MGLLSTSVLSCAARALLLPHHMRQALSPKQCFQVCSTEGDSGHVMTIQGQSVNQDSRHVSRIQDASGNQVSGHVCESGFGTFL